MVHGRGLFVIILATIILSLAIFTSGMSGSSTGINANLTIFTNYSNFNPFVNDDITFFANYTNISGPINGACNISFTDLTNQTMMFNGTQYNFSRSFDSAGNTSYNVTCDFPSADFNVTATTSFTVLPIANLTVLDNSTLTYVISNAENVEIVANYTDLRLNSSMTGSCNTTFSDIGVQAMTFNGSHYVYTRTFGNLGDIFYNVSCNALESGTNISTQTNGIQRVDECYNAADIILNATYSPANIYCDTISTFRLIDIVPRGGIPPRYWNNLTNATLLLPTNLTTSTSIIQTLLDVSSIHTWADATCLNIGLYSATAVLENSSIACFVNTTFDLVQNSTNPFIEIEFPFITNLTLNTTHNFTINVTNSGSAEAFGVDFNVTSGNNQVLNLFRIYQINNISANITINVTLNITPLLGGNTNFTRGSVAYNSSSNQTFLLLQNTSNNFHVNFNPSLSNIDNITLAWPEGFTSTPYNDSINLSAVFSDTDTYDNVSTAIFTFTNFTNLSFEINSSTFIVNTSALNNATGRFNTTLIVNDTFNVTASSEFVVFVENSSSEQCNNLDDDGDTLIDEGEITQSCCAFSQCQSLGTKTCQGAGVFGACVNSIEDTGGGNSNTGGGGSSPLEGNSNPPDETKNNKETLFEEDVITEEPQLENQEIEQSNSKDSTDTTFKTTKDFSQFIEIKHDNNKTFITETIKNIKRTKQSNLIVRKIFDKEVLLLASQLETLNKIIIIEEDPVIDFIFEDLDYLEEVELVYSLPGTITKTQIESIQTEFRSEQEYTQEQIEQQEAQQTQQAEESLQTQIVEEIVDNKTQITIKLDLEENIESVNNVEIEQFIPKCLIEEITDTILEAGVDQSLLNSVEIKEADPLIVWNFKEVDENFELKLQLDTIRSEDCDDEIKIKTLAKNYIQTRYEYTTQGLTQSIALTLGIVILFMILFFITTKDHFKHESPHVHKLVKTILHRLHKGEKEEHIKRQLRNEHELGQDITEAFAFVKEKKKSRLLHHLSEQSVEIFIFIILFILNSIDFAGIIPGYADWIKKLISWLLMLLILYKVDLTKVFFNNSKPKLNIAILLGMFLMHLKSVVEFAQKGLEGQVTFIYDLYSWIWNNRLIFDTVIFYVGAIILLFSAIYVAWRVPIRESCLYHLATKHEITEKFFHRIKRSIGVCFLFFVFFFTVFNRVLEWLAISIDAAIFVLAFFILFGMLFSTTIHKKNKSHNVFYGLLYSITDNLTVLILGAFIVLAFIKPFIPLIYATAFTISLFVSFGITLIYVLIKNIKTHFEGIKHATTAVDSIYVKFIKLFKYPQTFFLGIAGLFILQQIVEIGLYIIPNITGHAPSLYLTEGEQSVLSLFTDTSIIAQHLFALPVIEQVVFGLLYLLSLIGAFLLFFIPIYVWMIYFTYRSTHPSYISLPKIIFTQHRWIQRIGKFIIITGIPLTIVTLTTQLLQIVPLTLNGRERTIGIVLEAQQISLSYTLALGLVTGSVISCIVLLLLSKRLRSVLTYATVWFVLGTSITIYFWPFVVSILGFIQELYLSLLVASPLIVVAISVIIVFTCIDLLIVYGVGTLTMFFYVLPRAIKKKIVIVCAHMNIFHRYFFLATDMHILEYYEDAREHFSGNLVHHLDKYVREELHKGHHMESIILQLQLHHYPPLLIDEVVEDVLKDHESIKDIEHLKADHIDVQHVKSLVHTLKKRKQHKHTLVQVFEEYEDVYTYPEIKLAYRFVTHNLKGDLSEKYIEKEQLTHLHHLATWIQKAKEKHFSRTHIINKLTRSGWDPELVASLLDAKHLIRVHLIDELITKLELLAKYPDARKELYTVLEEYSYDELLYGIIYISEHKKENAFKKIDTHQLEKFKQLLLWIHKAQHLKRTEHFIKTKLTRAGWDEDLIHKLLQCTKYVRSQKELLKHVEHHYLIVN